MLCMTNNPTNLINTACLPVFQLGQYRAGGEKRVCVCARVRWVLTHHCGPVAYLLTSVKVYKQMIHLRFKKLCGYSLSTATKL